MIVERFRCVASLRVRLMPNMGRTAVPSAAPSQGASSSNAEAQMQCLGVVSELFSIRITLNLLND